MDTLPVGCLLDCCHGLYNLLRIQDLAEEYGYEGHRSTSIDDECLIGDSDEALEFLQEFAPEDHCVDWLNGDLVCLHGTAWIEA